MILISVVKISAICFFIFLNLLLFQVSSFCQSTNCSNIESETELESQNQVYQKKKKITLLVLRKKERKGFSRSCD